ncbi:hypothetical protein GXW82_06065 [Streptacidiphilus sp. 4-A2]|nr:hypothetical protein [Streptacidiphilus sp. 4-A2]
MSEQQADCAEPEASGGDGWMRRVWLMWHAAFVFLVLVILFNLATGHDAWPSYVLVGRSARLMPGCSGPRCAPGTGSGQPATWRSRSRRRWPSATWTPPR